MRGGVPNQYPNPVIVRAAQHKREGEREADRVIDISQELGKEIHDPLLFAEEDAEPYDVLEDGSFHHRAVGVPCGARSPIGTIVGDQVAIEDEVADPFAHLVVQHIHLRVIRSLHKDRSGCSSHCSSRGRRSHLSLSFSCSSPTLSCPNGCCGCWDGCGGRGEFDLSVEPRGIKKPHRGLRKAANGFREGDPDDGFIVSGDDVVESREEEVFEDARVDLRDLSHGTQQGPQTANGSGPDNGDMIFDAEHDEGDYTLKDHTVVEEHTEASEEHQANYFGLRTPQMADRGADDLDD
jgi:hypothetical protein